MANAPISPEYPRFSRQRIKRFQPLRRKLQYGVVWIFLTLAAYLPVKASQSMGRWLGALLYLVIRRDRSISEYQLRMAFPELDGPALQRLARRCFQHLGITFFETLAIPRIRREAARWVRLEGEEAIRTAYGGGRGVILVTAHVGNWELLAVAFEELQIPVQAMARTIPNSLVNDLIIRHRESEYLKVVQRGSSQSPRQLLRCLKHGDVLLLVLDHDIPTQGVFVNFFGIPAHTPRVAASLALKLKVPIVMGLGTRMADGSQVFRFESFPVPDTLQSNAEGIHGLTQSINDIIEAHIRANPEQWTWNHRRWKRRPEATEGVRANPESPSGEGR